MSDGNVIPFVPRSKGDKDRVDPQFKAELQCLELLGEGRELKITIRDPAGGSHTLGPYQLQADFADVVMAWLRAAWNDRREGREQPAVS